MSGSKPHITSLPYDTILEIGQCIHTADVLSLSLTSLQMRGLFLSLLYRSMLLGSSAACASALPMLRRNPEVCRCVRELRVRPNYRLSWPIADTYVDEAWVADLVAEIATHLNVLHTFEWDGAELAGDPLWMSLRVSCPELKAIHCTTTFREFHPNSELFKIDNLSAFSLCVRRSIDGPPRSKGWNFPVQLWNMIYHCPNLELLNISSPDASVQYVPVWDLTNGRWPRFHSLTLTLMQYEVEHRLEALHAFLLAHPTIRHLAIHPRTWNRAPQHTLFAPGALPMLSSFVGAYYHLERFSCPREIRILDLTYAPVSHGVLERLVSSLRSFVALTNLDLRLNDSATREELRELSSCPALVCLRLTFLEYIEIRVWDITWLAKALRDLPRLRTFSLEKGYLLEDSTLKTALLLLKHVPWLKEINLRWTDRRCLNQLKEHGTFTAVDKAGCRYLEVWERGLESNEATFSRCYRHRVPA
ncbi:hypothetical protein B0H17DRAFT_1209329 [Mycena rosella]|uniref:F-box domain-containing protein n=1 Tax=Mycena rosella TaxID=1033263 RepID=A0AAD7CZ29_MYCRO|nr:hypothetical protein B0H17DRAFT_1209329 [Mycena rosella]